MQVQRARLLAALAIVRPALVGRPYIQSLSHVLLDKGWPMASLRAGPALNISTAPREA